MLYIFLDWDQIRSSYRQWKKCLPNKIIYQNKIREMFKSIPPFKFLHKNGCNFASELEIIEIFPMAISGISMKKVTELLYSVVRTYVIVMYRNKRNSSSPSGLSVYPLFDFGDKCERNSTQWQGREGLWRALQKESRHLQSFFLCLYLAPYLHIWKIKITCREVWNIDYCF